MRAIGYASQNPYEINGVEDQIPRIYEYAAREHIDLVIVHRDEPVYVGPDHKARASLSGLANVLDDIARSTWQALIVTNRDRIEREDVPGVLDLLELHHKRLVVVGEELGIPQKRTPLAERLLRGREKGARRGYHQSGPTPYGYRRRFNLQADRQVLEPHPTEAPVVKTIFQQYLRLRSVKRVAEHLEGQGKKTRRKKVWSRAGISWILKNKTYLGLVHFGDISSKGKHPRLVDPHTFAKARDLLKKNNKRGGKASA